jgi:hypothetical protein
VRFRRQLAIAALSLAAASALPAVSPAFGQSFDQPSEELRINAGAAATWDKAGESIVALEGPVSIELDTATLTAKRAVIWLSKEPGDGNRQRAQVALIGDAKVVQRDATRSAERLMVTALVNGKVRFTAETRVEDDRSDTELYETADKLRRESVEAAAAPPTTTTATTTAPTTQAALEEPAPRVPAPVPPPNEPIQPGPAGGGLPPLPPKHARPPKRDASHPTPSAEVLPPSSVAQSQATTQGTLPPVTPIDFSYGSIETVTADDGTMAIALGGGVTVVQRSPVKDHPELVDLVEMRADSAVLFTTIKDPQKDLKDLGSEKMKQAIEAAYLEGDVRIVYTPGLAGQVGENRLEAKRVYYELKTKRAILTEAVLHTIQPQVPVPIVVRAKVIRQLAEGEYKTTDAQLSTSRFATPSYSINAQKLYVRREPTDDPRLGSRNVFESKGTTFEFFDVPVFYLPAASGSMTDRGFPLRGLGFTNSTKFGTGIKSNWGLFESIGVPPPKDLDASYRLDYFSDRGPAGGLDFEYGGGVFSHSPKEDFNFEGKFTGYGVYDHGFDDVGRGRVGEFNFPTGDDDHPRGHFLYEHQHFFADDFQLQFRAGYVSDATFLEQWFEREFDEEDPHDLMAYLKRQHDTEAYTFIAQAQPSNVVTTSDLQQEQFEVERLPELGYRRIGDSFFDDRATFFTRDTVGGYRFNLTRATLAEQGFDTGARSPGFPSLGFTGTNQDYVVRGDFRQEVDFPIAAGPLKVVPYVVGRYTGYSDSPHEGDVQRLFGAVGARASTAFWKNYDNVESKLFDIHRIRHIIEPEVNVFASGATHDRNDVFIYEEDVDAINDISATQFAIRQRWQTKRGGPGRWRSVDVFTLNIEANLFANEPKESQFPPRGFRGLFFASNPEASIPRDSLNADASWRISDNTIVLADAQQNLNENRLATAAIGLLVRRDERLTYFVGNRYIDELNSNITTVAFTYELSSKYLVAASQSYDFGLAQNVSSSIAFIRQFDALQVEVSLSHDSTSDETSFNFNVVPKGFGYGLAGSQLNSVFRNER